MKTHTSSRNRWQRTIIVLLLVCGLALLGVFYAMLVRRHIGIPCLFYTITGLRCPGCGISRALAALLQGRVDAFLKYNLLSPLIVLYVLFVSSLTAVKYILDGRLAYRSPTKWFDIGVLATLLFWWVVRNIFNL